MAKAKHMLDRTGVWGMAMITVLPSCIEGHAFYSVSGMTTVLFFGLLVGPHLREGEV